MRRPRFTGNIIAMTQSSPIIPVTTAPIEPASGSAKERLLIAATLCYERRGIAKTTMEDIAQQANLTRRTVYRHYPSHKDMLAAVVVQQSVKFLTKMHSDLQEIEDFSDYFVEALIYTIERGPSAPTHTFLFNFDSLPLVHEMFIASEALIQQAAELWQSVYQQRSQGSLDMHMLTEWYNRITVSYLTIPSSQYNTEQQLRLLLQTLAKPVLQQRT